MKRLSTQEKQLIRDSGLFDPEWYCEQYPDVAISGIDPLEHFLEVGIYLERKPNPLFDPVWYLESNDDLSNITIDPLVHFIDHGAFEQRRPHPCFSIDKVHRHHPDLAEKGRNPLEFYLSKDWIVDPCPEATMYLSLDCASSLAQRHLSLSANQFQAEENTIISTDNNLFQETPSTDIRAIALYLPQYHTIPENDEWWGEGFTEWTNVRRARPFYSGHYQPHIPHQDVGYYDLKDESVLERQAEMARAAGIEGFCFYYYWFNGRRLLNMPTDRMLESGKPDFPYCFCWANENWTRTWDGGDKEILVEQEHTLESDERFILDLLPTFRDPRYIRIDGKPLLVVYRPGLFPDPQATVKRWRDVCHREGIGEIVLARMQMFDWELKGKETGFDTVIQFPPVSRGFSPEINNSIKFVESDSFQGLVRDYRYTASNYPFEELGKSLWPGVAPSWDNTARRMERGTSWKNATPENYHIWLKTAVQRARETLPPQERFVFINAWNEWAEGCHLEPDEKHGYAWLNATKMALTARETPLNSNARRRVLVVGHDAFRAGAQIVLLTMLQEWRRLDQCDFQLVLLGDGVLRNDFEKVCDTLVLTDYSTDELQNQALKRFCRSAPDVILANTVVIGPSLSALKYLGVPVVAYIHELQKSIERWASGPIMAATVENSDHFIAVSNPVADNLKYNHLIPSEKISCVNEYVKTSHAVTHEMLIKLRSELGINPGDKIVFGCGTMDWRKGPDLFAEVADHVLKDMPRARFIWIGGDNDGEASTRAQELAENPRIHFIGERDFPRDYLALGSAFFLSSREDPYPLVALEAADAGLPIVCFSDSGGMPEFVGNACGRTVPYEDTHAATRALVEMLSDHDLLQSLGATAQESVRTKHDSVKGSEAVLAVLENLCLSPEHIDNHKKSASAHPLVSVIVPNYNHARFLPERLASIAEQTLTDLEIILLDDCSTDESMNLLRDFAASEPRARLLPNQANSGSTFKQWRKGFAEVRGKYIWIAESDDSAHPDFLKTLVARLEANKNATLSACCPRMTDLEGKDLGIPKDWFADIGGERWEKNFSADGMEEIKNVLSKKNAILNASGVMFRNSSELLNLVDDSMRLCADWLFWVRLLTQGDFEYVARPLNYWRLDSSNARTKPPGELEWDEGSKVLEAIAAITGLREQKKNRLLEDFRKRCAGWLASANKNTSDGVEFQSTSVGEARRPMVIAVHLPQFHPFKENNEWWGDGFTEWTNVRKAKALFPAHDQPQVPTELGYYDLREAAARAAQADLARAHGIDGFCYYHYWFNGHRLMEEPVEEILRLGEPDLPFSLCWANETWSRRWLGEEKDVLISQTYSEEDNLKHSEYLANMFSDPRYIRVNGRPLFVIYRPNHIPVLDHFIKSLRTASMESGCGNPYILGCSAHAEGVDMRSLGMDGTFDFQPKLGFLPEAFEENHTVQRLERNKALGVDSPNLRLYDAPDFRKQMADYRNSLGYPVHPSVFVGWDNTPRRGDKGTVLLNNTPEEFGKSLESAQSYLQSEKFSDEGIIFINAWNEWAEGNYLEPDMSQQTRFLEQVTKVLKLPANAGNAKPD